jgi:hypothetical protein
MKTKVVPDSINSRIVRVGVINHIQKINPNNMKEKTYYTLEIRLLDNSNGTLSEVNSFKEEKTFEQFEIIYNSLKKNHPKTTPKFPSKSFMASKTPDNLNKWKNGLDGFIKQCIAQTDIYDDPEFHIFLNLGKFDIKQTCKLLRLDSYSSSWAVRDFIQMPDGKDRILVTSSDTSKIGKLDAYLMNLDYKGPTVPISSCRIIRITCNGFILDKQDFLFNYSISCSHVFGCYISVDKHVDHIDKEKSQEIVINESKDKRISIYKNSLDKPFKNYIVLGFTNGLVFILEDCSDQKYLRLISKFSTHKGKVRSVFLLDEKTLITVGKSTLKLWNLEKLSIIKKKRLDHEIIKASFDLEKTRITCGLKSGYIECYTISSHNFVLSEKVRVTCKESIKDIFYSNKLMHVATNKGYIAEFNILENYECFNLIEKRCFKSTFSINTITFNQNIDEIIIGDTKGICAFFNNKNEMIFSRKINKDTIMKVLTFSNLLITASKEKIVTVWKIANVPIGKDDEILKNSSAYGQLMINNSIKDLDEQFKNLIAEPIMKNLKILNDDNKSKSEESYSDEEADNNINKTNKSNNSENDGEIKNSSIVEKEKEKFEFYNIFDDDQPNCSSSIQENNLDKNEEEVYNGEFFN